MPVLPLVASITVWPGFSSPDFSAASITPNARRSFTEPSGLNASILTNRFTCAGASLLMRTTGVLPTVPRIESNFAMSFLLSALGAFLQQVFGLRHRAGDDLAGVGQIVDQAERLAGDHGRDVEVGGIARPCVARGLAFGILHQFGLAPEPLRRM